jgi:putative methionine-R-sulfoxide reductase with GAF domain
MTGLFNDRYNLNLILAVLFVLGIGFSLYFIYSLPSSLSLAEGFQSEFIPVYGALVLTFAIGVSAIISALKYRKEVVVFRDRARDDEQIAREQAEHSGKTTISLESVKTNLQQSRNDKDMLQSAIQIICKQLEAGQGALYLVQESDGKRYIQLVSGYALTLGESTVIRYEFGEGLVGQSAAVGKPLYIDDIPEGYIKILSGLGSASPKFLLIVPVKSQDQVSGVIELASFTPLSEDQRKFVEESAQLIAEKITSKA